MRACTHTVFCYFWFSGWLLTDSNHTVPNCRALRAPWSVGHSPCPQETQDLLDMRQVNHLVFQDGRPLQWVQVLVMWDEWVLEICWTTVCLEFTTQHYALKFCKRADSMSRVPSTIEKKDSWSVLEKGDKWKYKGHLSQNDEVRDALGRTWQQIEIRWIWSLPCKRGRSRSSQTEEALW